MAWDAASLRRPHDRSELYEVLLGGAHCVVGQGHGVARNLDRCEDRGVVNDVDLSRVSERAVEHGT
ncbi:hypothetical protein [Streptomyces sioyaensis]|uniref:hypothetical protein n=1 Tax=Streptomyces sioyaensis TaxID=67364 RepID=UPI0037AFB53C